MNACAEFPRITCRSVILAAANLFDVTPEQITGPCKAHPLVHYRMAAMAAAYRLTGHGMTKVGRAFGGRDSTTVGNARVAARNKPEVADMCARLMAEAVTTTAHEVDWVRAVPFRSSRAPQFASRRFA